MLSITVNDDLSSHTVNEDQTLEFFFPPYNVLTTEPFTSEAEVKNFIISNVKEYDWWQPYVDPAVRAQEQSDLLAANNRAKRNQLLADSDWTQMNDSPLTNELKTAWATYRQSLRDITADESWPDVTFPATP